MTPLVPFHDGNSIPQLGLGVWQTPNDIAAPTVKAAIEAGYRHIDTAAAYRNEDGVGKGIRASDIDRKEMFVTTKVWNDNQGYDLTLKDFDASLKRLGMDYVDLYLIHWPVPDLDRSVETWKALIRLKAEERARSIGVSNFNRDQVERLIAETGVVPVINQIKLHPEYQQKAARAFHSELNIATQSWSPLGMGALIGHPVIAKIAARYGKTSAQLIIRWHIDNGLVVIPKSITPSRIAENLDVFDFRIDDGDMTLIDGLDDPAAPPPTL